MALKIQGPGTLQGTLQGAPHDAPQDAALLARVRQTFAADRFATEAAGAVIEAVAPRYARCTIKLEPVHRNARGAVMGGAIFTLADFAVAVASNGYKEAPDTVSLHASLTFLSPAKGQTLICEAACLKDGRTTCLYQVEVTDELGTQVACGQINGYVVAPRP